MISRRLLALFSLALAATIWWASPALATSIYDDYYNTTDQLVLLDDSCDNDLDISTTWTKYLEDSSYATSFALAKSGGSLGVSTLPRYNVDGNGHVTKTAVLVYWKESSTLSVTWPTWGYMQILGADRSIIMSLTGSGSSCSVSIGNYGNGSASYVSSNDGAVKNYFFNGDPNKPSGYAGPEIRGNAPPPKYVAMGDSYSSGEGVLPFENDSDTGANTCHRSVQAYPRLMQDSLDLGSTAFVACSGAVSDYIINDYNQENVELPQAVYMSEDAELVTISIGGNDIGFPDVMKACVAASSAQGCLDEIDTASDDVGDPSFSSDIEDMLTGIQSLGGTSTEIVVVGYPQLFAAFGDISGSCTWGTAAMHIASPTLVSNRTITEDEIDALRQVHDDLNGVLASAVGEINDSHVHFVDPTTAFAGHEICGAASDWINEVALVVSTGDIAAASFHPNADGQAAYADLLEDAINNF